MNASVTMSARDVISVPRNATTTARRSSENPIQAWVSVEAALMKVAGSNRRSAAMSPTPLASARHASVMRAISMAASDAPRSPAARAVARASVRGA